jgi:hypothetical protein
MSQQGGFGGYEGGSPAGEITPPVSGYGPPGGVPPLGGPMTPGSGRDVNTTLPLVLAIASTVLCCDPVLGLPAIVLAIQARTARDEGAIDLARRRARTALLVSIASIALGALFELYEGVRQLAKGFQ